MEGYFEYETCKLYYKVPQTCEETQIVHMWKVFPFFTCYQHNKVITL